MNGMVYRGEIYYVLPEGNEVGCEQRSGRPGIVVSNNLNNKNAATVEVVYLTTKEKKQLITHVFIDSAQRPSTAICEQITTVDKTRLNNYYGKLTQGEMEAVEVAIMASLGLDNYLSKPQPAPVAVAAPAPASVPAAPAKSSEGGHSHEDAEFIKVCVQRDTYKELCMELISRK